MKVKTMIIMSLLTLPLGGCGIILGPGIEFDAKVAARRVDEHQAQESTSVSIKNSQPFMCAFISCDNKQGGANAK